MAVAVDALLRQEGRLLLQVDVWLTSVASRAVPASAVGAASDQQLSRRAQQIQQQAAEQFTAITAGHQSRGRHARYPPYLLLHQMAHNVLPLAGTDKPWSVDGQRNWSMQLKVRKLS